MPVKGDGGGDGSSMVITGRQAQQEVSEELLTPDVSSPEEALLPCSLNAAVAGASGGALGAVFGFGGKAVRHSGQGRWRAARKEAWTSAKSFATFSGVFALASCFIQRLRNKQDALNGGLAGAVTGLVLGWSGGPWAAAQSAAMLGAFSYFVDTLNAGEAQACAALQARLGHARRRQRQPQFVKTVKTEPKHEAWASEGNDCIGTSIQTKHRTAQTYQQALRP
ncbi:hypothetical protein WJX81_004001 [Elliptochloris bilobata]|uniref:Uncharacterized protein n=1 Tax=Elliptochloris bilobata TaxID=381761 RepID=A0AAW1QNG2_9CHLO